MAAGCKQSAADFVNCDILLHFLDYYICVHCARRKLRTHAGSPARGGSSMFSHLVVLVGLYRAAWCYSEY